MKIPSPIEKLQQLLAVLPNKEIKTKKKVHKLVYLLQAAGADFGQDFYYHHYGVFSSTLAADLDRAEQEFRVLAQDQEEDDWGYRIRLTGEPATPSQPFLKKDQIEIATQLAAEEPALLEVLSTIVYLHLHFFRGTELKQTLAELKPKLEKHFPKAHQMARELYAVEA